MPEHQADEPAIRPEVVQAVFSALTDVDPSRFAPLQAAGIRITPAVQRQANQLYAASIEASFHQRERFARAMEVLIDGRKFSKPPGWAELFDGLSPEGASQLRDLYDRKYGWPKEI